MIYKEYEGFTKTYVICRATGFGVTEAPYIQKEVVYETNSYEAASNKQKELTIANNTEEEIKSTWRPNTYWINVNTLSDEGIRLHKELECEFNEKLAKMKESKDFDVFKSGEYTFHKAKFPEFEN